jgi:hypothetical protein
MNKVFRFLAIGAISVAFATLSIASAQSYTTYDYPGATATTLNGGPSLQGTSVGCCSALLTTWGFVATRTS